MNKFIIDKSYTRRDDMSPADTLSVYMQPDGDIVVTLFTKDDNDRYMVQTQVEFCNIGFGGGRSPNVRAALIALGEAIEKDNQEHPI